jgi:hypothetical protein
MLAERRENIVQRAAVVRVLSRATGPTSLFRSGEGTVFVYEEHRDWMPPTTLRTKITPDGMIGPTERFELDAVGS